MNITTEIGKLKFKLKALIKETENSLRKIDDTLLVLNVRLDKEDMDKEEDYLTDLTEKLDICNREIENLKTQLQSVTQRQRNLEIDYLNKIDHLESSILALINQVEENKNFVKKNYATWKEIKNCTDYKNIDRSNKKVEKLSKDVEELKIELGLWAK